MFREPFETNLCISDPHIMSSKAAEFDTNFRFFIGGRAADVAGGVEKCDFSSDARGDCSSEQRCKQTMSSPSVSSRSP